MNALKSSLLALGLTSGLLASCGQHKPVDHTAHSHITDSYACPMHPEIAGREGDVCPKCGMKLEKKSSGKTSMVLTRPSGLKAGEPVTLTLTPRNDSGIVPLEESHERKLHLIVVRDDLSWFDHIHPEEKPDGSYTVSETFPAGGKYLLYADYKPQGESQQTDTLGVHMEGEQSKEISHHPAKYTTEIAGYTVTVEQPDSLVTGSAAIPITIRKNGKKLTRQDLENYLGAVAHVILIDVDTKTFQHVHPESTEDYVIYAHTDFKNSGIYRMWVQFQTEGNVFTADFTLDVKNSRKQQHEHSPTHKH